ncbi:hypothetical protein NEUTE1DRAFT_123349 [Neurospora tetrasperma FGSC 2508]|uniref:Heterokaryon incompatibility domain-containing protein n=1 Tax=Neurospora tetrasperma (strain FGSC 2508 / ATCC MYA-4615 / P0657) TaxID=510951 RepID=F8MRP1_NEUT8|nr:uncharacterized protein NEUTE1DRAFT_123349 [Neurospora tetrasperma FGSC 2508]EGO56942.1 hypothetical protein NEUTE1DRAFT_123349 [Neurospora tetrasperma FGSC 2508]
MTTPAMDSTGVTAESSRSAEISPPSSAPPEVNKPNSQSPRPSPLPPYFRSYEAYIEHCVAQVGRDEIPEAAFDRLCTSCTAVFMKIARLIAGGKEYPEVPFCTINEFLRSAVEGKCHVCHWSLESGVDWLERGDAALTLCRCVYDLYWRVVKGDGTKGELTWIDVERNDGSYTRDRRLLTALTTASEASWNQALKWIENCRSHPLCNPIQTANAQDKWPARLVAVGDIGDAHVRICETSQPGLVEKPYMTLSHCWGENGVPIRLLNENYVRFLEGIQVGELPRTFRDAIDVTRKLKIPFLWIDSLCIIQNSNEDWIQESGKMQQVYQNSFLNLAAGASADANGGLFYRRHPLSITPWFIRIGEDRYLMAEYINEHTTKSYLSTELILYTRGWVLQEQLLARRTLIFGRKELHWECSTYQASESFPEFLDRPRSLYRDYAKIFRPDWQNLLGGKLVDSERQEAWNRLIKTYFRRSLTQTSDRLVAISGLAEQLSSEWSGITYLAGLWSYRLIQNLLWFCRGPCSQKNMEIAPSWSWASLIQPGRSGQLSNLGYFLDTQETVDVLAEVLEASVTPQNRTNAFGPIKFGGSIKLRSPVLRARITAIPDCRRDDCEDYNLGTLELEDIRICVQWDEANDVKVDVQDVYLVPFMIRYGGYNIMIYGLILKTAVYPHETQFQRAGHFFFFDKEPQERRDSNAEDAVLENQENSSDEGIDMVQKNIPQELKKKGLFRNIDLWFTKKVRNGLKERMDYLKKDPYVNGPPLNTTLENRYLAESGRKFLPHTSKVLEAIAQAAKHNKANGTPDPVLGLGEGNGYYTYEIV